MTTKICSFEELPEWVDKARLPNNGPGKECASYLVIEDDFQGNRVYSDAMEPEDAKFYRDLKWVKAELDRAFEENRLLDIP